MQTFKFEAADLFKLFGPPLTAMHRFTMHEMCRRYGVVDKKVLGVGPGDCAQEYWFHELGNSLFLVDIDENNELEPRLKGQAQTDARIDRPVTYVIGDARYVADWLQDKFDVIFTSGFTPDEAYRSDTLAAFGALTQAEPATTMFGTWPPDAGPLSPLCVEIATRGVADNGLFIMLSYASGPDIIRSRNYLPAMHSQLEKLGFHLLEAHCLAASPGVHLVVAIKSNDPAVVAARRAALKAMPPLSEIHARGEYDRMTVRIFPGPTRLGDVNPVSIPSRLLGRKLPGLENSVGSALDRYAPQAMTAYYAGEAESTEGLFLLSRGLGVEFGWDASLFPPKRGVEKGFAHPALLDAAKQACDKVDVAFLSFLADDEAQRAAALKTGGRLFDSKTLPFVSAKLRHNGMLLCQGRTGGVDLTSDTGFADRLASELSAGGFVLQEVHALVAAPGIFFFAAQRRAQSNDGVSTEPLHFFAGAEIQNTGVKVWPRSKSDTPTRTVSR
jgi:hypothetical protein